MNVKKKVVVEPREETLKSKDKGDDKEPVEIDEKLAENNKPQSDVLPTIQTPPSFLKRLKKKEENDKIKKFIAKLSNLSINIPLLKVIQEILGYANLMKKLMSKKKLVKGDTIEVTYGCIAIISSEMAKNKKDPVAFTIRCIIGTHKFEKALCDLGASINLMLFAIYMRLSLSTPTSTSMRFVIVDRSIKKSIGVLFNMLVKVDKFILIADFVVLDYEMDHRYLLSLVELSLPLEELLSIWSLGK
ncbi:uncharacterized protein LOC124896217 [Capsicum annuum]|uniref:uncharacterized protein LOC124896217 n=1 Tax=Capsicum annuum TaxID=4072 RepID=UPI001FB118AC|nr:uncharacterized protein LOC124896217 [Capsicum annuum]